jgi:acetoin utilization deacetylase AcuC-like enzyme
VKTFFYDNFHFPLPPEHRFPVPKYPGLRQRLLETGVLSTADLHIPEPATDEQILLVHTPEYVEKILDGTISEREMRRIGFPWSPGLVERSRRSVGATIAVCRTALEDGISASLAGGTHHAYPDHGEGYCVFNDVAIAVRTLQLEKRIARALIVDLDVHQGNGTAAIFSGDPTVFTFSVHGTKNFPFHKEVSDLDIALPDGTGDAAYLAAVETGLRQSLGAISADLAVYLAGADPFSEDRFGRMAVSKSGLAARDELVFKTCLQAGMPLALVMSGGYARNVEDIVDIHTETIRQAAAAWYDYDTYRLKRCS